MRQLLIENARRKRAPRHGGGVQPMNFDDVPVAIEVDETLELLRAQDAAKVWLYRHIERRRGK